MAFDDTWRDLRERCDDLDPDAVLLTPASERAFDVVGTDDDRITIAYRERDGERTLWRDGFAVLHDRLLGGEEIGLSDLPPGVEPYVSALSLSPLFEVDGTANVLRAVEGEEGSESPFLRPAWEVRTTPERVRDDALLLAGLLDRHDLDDHGRLDADDLADAYVLLSDVQRGADRLRRRVGEALLDRIGPDGRLHGRFGTVTRTRRERRHLKDADVIFDALAAHDIPREWVLGVDRDKLDVVLSVTDLDEDAVYDVEEQVYAQKTEVEEAAKQSRLQGLSDRLAALDADEAADLYRDLEALEERLDDALAAS